MNKFLEDYLKETIISEFITFMTLSEGAELSYLRGLSNPILTLCETDTEEVVKFAICNLGIWNNDELRASIYNVTGSLTTLNGGCIRIAEYTIRNI